MIGRTSTFGRKQSGEISCVAVYDCFSCYVRLGSEDARTFIAVCKLLARRFKTNERKSRRETHQEPGCKIGKGCKFQYSSRDSNCENDITGLSWENRNPGTKESSSQGSCSKERCVLLECTHRFRRFRVVVRHELFEEQCVDGAQQRNHR